MLESYPVPLTFDQYGRAHDDRLNPEQIYNGLEHDIFPPEHAAMAVLLPQGSHTHGLKLYVELEGIQKNANGDYIVDTVVMDTDPFEDELVSATFEDGDWHNYSDQPAELVIAKKTITAIGGFLLDADQDELAVLMEHRQRICPQNNHRKPGPNRLAYNSANWKRRNR